MTVGIFDLIVSQHDYERNLTFTLTDGGIPTVIPTGAVVTFHLTAMGTTTPSAGGGTCVVIDGSNGLVSYPWKAPDLDNPGAFWGTFTIAFGDGKQRTYPDTGYVCIRVLPSLA